MSSYLQQLENNEAVLLMYLAGELPAEDRAEVEQLLASDAGLRDELATLRRTECTMTLLMSEADGLSLPPATESARQSAAVRRVSRAMVRFRLERDRQADDANDADARAPSRALRLPGWSYPFAAAAMLLIAWVAYWGFTSAGPGHRLPREPELVERYPTELGGSQAEFLPREANPEADIPALAVQEGDRDLLAISAGSYDVSSMFRSDQE